jgi:ATP-dependent helicase HrpB
MLFSLPVDDAVPELKKALAENGMAILKAPPGSGKTTLVPLRLMDEPWLENRKILVLEPRRLAARLAAFRMSEVTCSRLGEKIGYHVRMDRRTGPSAKIEVLTEGILTGRIHADPMLEEVGLVIFDEFHERSIHADLGLALCMEIRDVFRNDLRILVMSATMDTERLSVLMGNVSVINASGSLFPVDVVYEKESLYSEDERLEKKTARKVISVINETEGDILVFLPGTGEIGRTADYLGQIRLPDSIGVHQLHGNLSLSDQEKAIAPDPEGKRKIVLSTSIAETSLTIEGVRTVIDCGLSRVPRFDSSRGMAVLETVPESMASAEQRRGRAGRLGPGKCYRMWPENRKYLFPDFSQPEIRTADLSSFALDLAMWGVSSPSELKLMDQPPEGAFGQARNLLNLLGAVETNGAVTEKGREMASLGVHPRLASMLISGKKAGFLKTAARIAALAGERDIIDSDGYFSGADEDIRTRLEILEKVSTGDILKKFQTKERTAEKMEKAGRA